MKAPGKDDLIRIGFVNKTSGFSGKVSCIIDEGNAARLLGKKFLFILLDGLPVPFFVEEIEQRGDELIVKFEDIDTEDEVKKILRKDIFSERQRTKKNAGISDWRSLIGFTAIDDSHGSLGKIMEVTEYPMQMIAKCMVNDKEVLFPLIDEIITGINEDEKILHIDLPEGLLDVYLNP